MGISEGCFIFDFASLPLEVARPIQPTMGTKVAVKHQSIIIITTIIIIIIIIITVSVNSNIDLISCYPIFREMMPSAMSTLTLNMFMKVIDFCGQMMYKKSGTIPRVHDFLKFLYSYNNMGFINLHVSKTIFCMIRRLFG